jgi:hypothetical protein
MWHRRPEPLADPRFRLVDLNDVVSTTLDRIDVRAAVRPGLIRCLDGRLPRVLGEPRMLGRAVAGLVTYGARRLGQDVCRVVVVTERVPSVVRGEFVARVRVGVEGAARRYPAARGVLPAPVDAGSGPGGPDPDLALTAWIAGEHGGVLHPTDGTLDLPGLAD